VTTDTLPLSTPHGRPYRGGEGVPARRPGVEPTTPTAHGHPGSALRRLDAGSRGADRYPPRQRRRDVSRLVRAPGRPASRGRGRWELQTGRSPPTRPPRGTERRVPKTRASFTPSPVAVTETRRADGTTRHARISGTHAVRRPSRFRIRRVNTPPLDTPASSALFSGDDAQSPPSAGWESSHSPLTVERTAQGSLRRRAVPARLRPTTSRFSRRVREPRRDTARLLPETVGRVRSHGPARRVFYTRC
jgi:hypothetical protein